ncbi:MAG: long-chain fatty acid--CoA ligase [Acidimicrobiia bacterium]
MTAASWYASRPWVSEYDEAMLEPVEGLPDSPLELFRASADRHGERVALAYFDGRLTYAELDRLSDGVAGYLADHGFQRGDRLALILQNVPQFVIALLGAWKAGGIVVPVNPMLRERELLHIFGDAGVRAVVCAARAWSEYVGGVADAAGIEIRLTTDEHELQTRDDPRVLATTDAGPVEGADDLLTVARDAAPRAAINGSFAIDDVALISYTSGTTGLPKGAMNTHGNLVVGAALLSRRRTLPDPATIFGLAPLFHITGMVCQVVATIDIGARLALTYRFEPGVVLDALSEHRPDYMVGPSTAYIALMSRPEVTHDHFASFATLYSGGAPLPPAVVDEYRERFGHYIHNGYGLTESTAGCIVVPGACEAPIDPGSGTLSIGVPVPGVDVRILDDEGAEVPPGESGEIAVRGPMVVAGYWNQPEATAGAMPDGELRTGDIGFMDERGWVYVVDRKKDMIIASGYKVWPREVEDVLYTHPAVREAAVVGVPDSYRGETVKAFVSLRPGSDASAEELIGFCRERLAAYKYPRMVEVIDELPKTATGKILRRELRDQARASTRST